MKLTLLTTAFFVAITCTWSQNPKDTFSIGHLEKFYSNLLKSESTLIVSLPENYESSEENYPLVIYLDGLTTAQITTATHDVHHFANWIPDAIMIGIQPIDRNENYIPWKDTYFRTGGGADTYVKFISEELIPYIDSTYRTQNYRIIIGGSLGGLFVLHTLISIPNVFDCYLALSPACSFHNSQIIKNAETFLNQNIDLSKKYLFLSLANEGERMGVNDFVELIKQSSTNINWEFKNYPEEVHSSAGYKSIGDGLKFFYSNWIPNNLPTISPMGDVFLAGDAVNVEISNNKLPVTRYTLDGSDPTQGSPLYTMPISVDKNMVLKAKSFYPDGKHGFTNTATFSIGKYLEASINLPELENGLTYRYYEGEWSEMPDFNKIKAKKSGKCDFFNLLLSNRDDYYGFAFSGYIKIPTDGKYTFYLNADDAAKLFIGSVLVIDDQYSQYNREKQASIFLKKGMHPITVNYYENIWAETLSIKYKSETTEKQEIGFGNLFRVRE